MVEVRKKNIMKTILIFLVWLVAVFFAVLSALGLNALFPMPLLPLFFIEFFFGFLYSSIAMHIFINNK